MGLRCLLGHDFTEPKTEREREERGDEVITTIREVKECRRCGETQVVAENTEVTSLSRRFGAGADAGSDQGTDSRGTTNADDPVVAPETGSVESTSSPGATTGTDTVVDEAEPQDDGFDHPFGDPENADPSVDDDAEIIRDGPADATDEGSADESADHSAGTGTDVSGGGERGHGEWPNSEKTHPTEAEGENQPDATGRWPDPAADHDAASDEPGGRRDVEDAAATEARTGIASDVDRSGAGPSESDPSRADRSETDPEPRTPAPEDEDVEFIDADDADDADEPSPWPEQEGDDEGFDAEVGDGRPDEDVTVDGNLTPRVNPNAEVDEDAEFVESSGSSTSSRPRSSTGEGAGSRAGRSSGAPSSTPPERAKNGSRSGSGGGRRTERTRQPTATHEVELTTTAGDREMEYVCPKCGKREPVGASSMRAGDICPECKRGYIEEHELE